MPIVWERLKKARIWQVCRLAVRTGSPRWTMTIVDCRLITMDWQAWAFSGSRKGGLAVLGKCSIPNTYHNIIIILIHP